MARRDRDAETKAWKVLSEHLHLYSMKIRDIIKFRRVYHINRK